MCKKFLQQSFHSGLHTVGVGGKMLGNADILTALKVDTSSIVHSKIKYVGFKNTSKICTLACNNHEGRFF